jgi:hypothetical protein
VIGKLKWKQFKYLSELKSNHQTSAEFKKLCGIEDQYKNTIANIRSLTETLKNMGVKWIATFSKGESGFMFNTLTWEITTQKNAEIEKVESEIRSAECEIAEITKQNIEFLKKISEKDGFDHFEYCCIINEDVHAHLCPLCHIRFLYIHHEGYNTTIAECFTCDFRANHKF